METTYDTAASGLWYEDFAVGVVRRTPARTITEADIVNFAGLTGDFALIHTDAEYARTMPYGGERIAHGLLGLAFAQGLAWRTGYTGGTGFSSLGWDKWRFRKPIKIGDTIHVRWHLLSKRDSGSNPAVGIIVEKVEIINQHGVVVQDGNHTSMMKKRPAGRPVSADVAH